jgi:hypothetical protein
MPVKIFAAIVAVVLVIGYLTPVVLKLKEAALAIVIAVGIAMMLVDLWQSFRERE